jgi:hypothetical protein
MIFSPLFLAHLESETNLRLFLSCGVLRRVEPDGAPPDGDDELHPRLPDGALGRHAAPLLAAPRHHRRHSHPPHLARLEVRLGIP